MGLISATGLVLFGLLVGAYGTLVGAGGGFLIVPMLLLLYGASPQQAVGTSLLVVFFNALSGTLSYARQRRIDYRTGVKFALATIPGSILGAYLSNYLTTRLFRVVFGLLLLGIAVFLMVRPEAAPEEGDPPERRTRAGLTQRRLVDARGDIFLYAFNEREGIILSLFVGFFSSILGIGGGIIHVPALVHLFTFPAHVATATSHFILTISALVGSASHLALGHVLGLPAILMAVGVIIGAQGGAYISQRLQGRWIVRLLSLALIFVGIRLFLS